MASQQLQACCPLSAATGPGQMMTMMWWIARAFGKPFELPNISSFFLLAQRLCPPTSRVFRGAAECGRFLVKFPICELRSPSVFYGPTLDELRRAEEHVRAHTVLPCATGCSQIWGSYRADTHFCGPAVIILSRCLQRWISGRRRSKSFFDS